MLNKLTKMVLLISLLLTAACTDHQKNTYNGYIEGRYIYLSSKVSGRLEQLNVHKGETVKQGQLVFVLEAEPEASELKATEAQLEAARNNLLDLEKPQRETVIQKLKADIAHNESLVLYAKQTLERMAQLKKASAIGQADLDRAQSSYQAAKANLEAAQAALAESSQGARVDKINEQRAQVKTLEALAARQQWQLQQKEIHIPQDGFIDNTFYRAGEFVEANKPVASLLTPDNRVLLFFVPENQLSHIQMGQGISFTCDGCESTNATIVYIGSKAEYTPPVVYSKDSREKLVYFIEAKIDPAKVTQFHPGQPVEVQLKE